MLLQASLHILLLLPLVLLIIDFAQDNLTANPIREIQLRTGRIAINILMASLACTPIYILSGFSVIMRLRRILGLYAFLYVLLHLVNFIWIDYGFNWSILGEDLFEKRYAIAGFVSFLLLLPLAVTSFFRLRQKLGKAWQKLHFLVYSAGIAAIVHFLWQEKIDILLPSLYGVVLLILLIIRIPVIRNYFNNRIRRIS
ncbi:MAG: sulfoxide reductase heme-binding subunit YedZ [Dehalococcoidales bacterium]|nr:MAG: sulfoxide reductase heme-binding subunit YedZ [Dehalococcoidales bacterium]